MFSIALEYADALFLLGPEIVCGDTHFRRSGVLVNDCRRELIQVWGPNQSIAHDIVEFENQLRAAIVANIDEVA